jgi:transcriptional regulator with XRE-family HTH domain
VKTPPQRRPRFPDTPWGRLRGSAGWSLRDLAALTGINPADLSRIERGIGPTPDHARRLLAVYDGAR